MPVLDLTTGFPQMAPARVTSVMRRYLQWRDAYRTKFEARISDFGFSYPEKIIDLDFTDGTAQLKIPENAWQVGSLLRSNSEESWVEGLDAISELDDGILVVTNWLASHDSLSGIVWTDEDLRKQASAKYAAFRMFTFMLTETAENYFHYRPRAGAGNFN